MTYNLCVSTAVIGKAERYQYNELATKLKPVEWTIDQIEHHLTNRGHPICTADLKVGPDGFARRNSDSFISSSIVGIDVDSGRDSFAAAAKNDYFLRNACFAYTTPSHTEIHPRYRVIFILETPITNMTEYKALTTALATRFGGDTNALDAVRLWFGNPDAQTVAWYNTLSDDEVQKLLSFEDEVRHEETKFSAFGARKLTPDDVRMMLKFIPKVQDHIDWKRTVAAVVDALGDTPETLQILEEWSPSTKPYSQVVKDRLTRVTTGTLIYLARKNHCPIPKDLYKDPPKDAAETFDRIESYLTARYEFRKNTATQTIEYRDNPHTQWDRLEDYTVNSMLRSMRASGLKIGRDRIWEILDSDFSPTFDPIAEYFNHLDEWRDGDTDHIGRILDLIPPDPAYPVDAQRAYNDLIFRKWIVAAVACAIDNKANHTMLILQGGQGVGKTTLLRYLCPEHLRRDHYYEGSINDDRDTLVSIARSLIIVDDELESLTKREAEKIKSLITAQDKRVRLAYGRAETTLRRRGSFAGSVNRRSFLNDETGSRRFAVIAIGGFIDLSALFNINVDAVWAQALALKKAGFQYWTSPKDIERMSAMNANYAVSTEADDLVWRYVEALPTDSAAGMSNTEIMTTLIDKVQQERNAKLPWLNAWQLGRALTKAGFEQKVVRDGTRTVRVWKVKIRAVGRSIATETQSAVVHDIRGNAVGGAKDVF
jgi:hypothetical protein